MRLSILSIRAGLSIAALALVAAPAKADLLTAIFEGKLWGVTGDAHPFGDAASLNDAPFSAAYYIDTDTPNKVVGASFTLNGFTVILPDAGPGSGFGSGGGRSSYLYLENNSLFPNFVTENMLWIDVGFLDALPPALDEVGSWEVVNIVSQARLRKLDVNTGLPEYSLTAYLDVERLTTTRAVPEPATWAMMILGFGAIAASLRARRRPAHRQPGLERYGREGGTVSDCRRA